MDHDRQPGGRPLDLVEVGPVLGAAPADQVVRPALGPARRHQPAECPDHLQLLLVVAGAGHEEAADRQDDRLLGGRGHRRDRRVEHAVTAAPHPLGPALGVGRVGHDPVVAGQEVEPGARPDQLGHGPGQGRPPPASGVGAQHRDAEAAGVGADAVLGRHPRRAPHVDGHGVAGATSTSNGRATLRRSVRPDGRGHDRLADGGPVDLRGDLDRADLGRHEPPQVHDHRHRRPRGALGHGDHKRGVARGPAEGVQPGLLGQVEALAPGDGRAAEGGGAPPGEPGADAGGARRQRAGEVHDVERCPGAARVAALVAGVDEQVVVGRRRGHAAGGLGHQAHAHRVEVEAEAFAQPRPVDGLVRQQLDLVVPGLGQRGGDATGELLAPAAGRPVAVVDRDPHRGTRRATMAASGTVAARRMRRRSRRMAGSIRRNPTNDTARRRVCSTLGRCSPSTGRTRSRRA